MLKNLALAATCFVVLLSTFARTAHACACCAEPGTYGIWTTKPDSYKLDILKQIEFSKHAELFMTEAGFDSIKGLSAIERDFDDPTWIANGGDFDTVNTFNGKGWTFTFKTPKGKSGSLRLPIPTQMVVFNVDIYDGSDHGNGPLLYKEFRFKGTVASGSGFLGGSIVRPTSYFLVFQGRGNGCDNVEDFNNWNLQINGAKARYQLFGKLSNTDAPKNQTKKD